MANHNEGGSTKLHITTDDVLCSIYTTTISNVIEIYNFSLHCIYYGCEGACMIKLLQPFRELFLSRARQITEVIIQLLKRLLKGSGINKVQSVLHHNAST